MFYYGCAVVLIGVLEVVAYHVVGCFIMDEAPMWDGELGGVL